MHTRSKFCHITWVMVVGLLAAVFADTSIAQIVGRENVNSSGVAGNDASSRPVISADGRYVAFVSHADNLVASDTNLVRDVFVRDRSSGVTVRVSVGVAGLQANEKSDRPSISDDGRFIAFYSDATNLIEIDANGVRDVFVHGRDPDGNGVFDEDNGETALVSVADSGFRGNGSSTRPSISGDGRYIAFRTVASNLVPNDTNGFDDILVHDRVAGETFRVRLDSSGNQASNGDSDRPSISADGRYIAFSSDASDLVDGDAEPFHPTTCPSCIGF